MVNCLVIDGNIAERQRVATWLIAMGHACHQADFSPDAVRACNDNAPEVVFIAQSRTTAAYVQQIKETRRHPIVMVYSDKTDLDLITTSILAGASDVLVKPFDRDHLRFKLQQNGIDAA